MEVKCWLELVCYPEICCSCVSLGAQTSQSYTWERNQLGLNGWGWKSERKGNSISWRSSQQAPQWAGPAWRQSAHLLQAPAAFMCNHATYVWTALVFIHRAGVNPCKSSVGATGSAAITHFLGCCCVSADPTGCQCSGGRGGDCRHCPAPGLPSIKAEGTTPLMLPVPALIHCCRVCRLAREREQPKMAMEIKCSACWLTPSEI